MVICDTNIIIEVLKDDKDTINIINKIGIENISISSVTIMELYYGALNKKELNLIKKYLSSLNVIQISSLISENSVKLIENYSKSHGLQIPDAIIASTSILYGEKLFTYNIKDFKFISGLDLYNL